MNCCLIKVASLCGNHSAEIWLTIIFHSLVVCYLFTQTATESTSLIYSLKRMMSINAGLDQKSNTKGKQKGGTVAGFIMHLDVIEA
jgi:hypothetical protein